MKIQAYDEQFSRVDRSLAIDMINDLWSALFTEDGGLMLEKNIFDSKDGVLTKRYSSKSLSEITGFDDVEDILFNFKIDTESQDVIEAAAAVDKESGSVVPIIIVSFSGNIFSKMVKLGPEGFKNKFKEVLQKDLFPSLLHEISHLTDPELDMLSFYSFKSEEVVDDIERRKSLEPTEEGAYHQYIITPAEMSAHAIEIKEEITSKVDENTPDLNDESGLMGLVTWLMQNSNIYKESYGTLFKFEEGKFIFKNPSFKNNVMPLHESVAEGIRAKKERLDIMKEESGMSVVSSYSDFIPMSLKNK